jgi:hypothetical protein
MEFLFSQRPEEKLTIDWESNQLNQVASVLLTPGTSNPIEYLFFAFGRQRFPIVWVSRTLHAPASYNRKNWDYFCRFWFFS